MTSPNNRYKDSISSSATYYNNPFREDLDCVKATHKLRTTPKPSKPNQEAVMEKRWLEQLSGQGEAVGKFFLIGQIIKSIFYALMLPVYILFYGLPKRLIKSLSPLLKAFSLKMAAFFMRLSKKGLNFWLKFKNGVIRVSLIWPKAKLTSLANQTAKGVGSIIARVKQSFGRWVSQPLKLIREQVKKVFTSISFRINKIAEKAKNQSAKMTRWFKEKWAFCLKPFKKLFNWLKSKDHLIKEKIERAAEAISKKLAFFKTPIKTIRMLFQKAIDLARRTSAYSKGFANSWATKFALIGKRWLSTVKDYGLTFGNWIEVKTQPVRNLLTRTFARIYQKFLKPIINRFQLIRAKIAELLKRGSTAVLARIKPPLAALSRVLTKFTNNIKAQAQKLLEVRKSLVRVGQICVRWIKEECLALPLQIMTLLKKSFRTVLFAIRKFFQIFTLLKIAFRVLIRYSKQMIREKYRV